MKRSATAFKDISCDDYEESKVRFQEKAIEQAWNDPQVFATNLDRLIQMKGLTLKKTAKKVGANYQWIRRIVTRGMVRITDERKPTISQEAHQAFQGKQD